MTTIRFLLLLFLFSFATSTSAQVQDVELRVFSQPTLLAGNGRFKQAAEQYHRLSLQILASEAKLGTEKMWQYAGLAEALATVCANLDNDPKAYEYWANSVRYLLTGGTEWSQMQQYLHQKNEQANTQLLTQMQTFDVAGGYDQSWENDAAVLQVWQEKLNLFAFSGPKIGLKSTRTQTSLPSSTPPPVATQTVPGQKKLKGIESNFSQSQGFVPKPASQPNETPEGINNAAPTSAPARAVVTNRHLIQTSPAPAENEVTIIATPIDEFDYEAAERDEINALANEADLGDLDNTLSTERQVPRANIGAESSSGVEAVQRRSFAPVPVEQENQ
ncbi:MULTISPECIES: hypothetical protein [Vibrio]|uniref:Uncharacterized protein n=1 Tax=Vibrio mediterranei TaxID=689 RepID=A0A3G4VDQ1_9VIBR|nr:MULTISPECIES: hypothetical protein [Vibrio]AYV22824.1 hypothetical protein ECB94_16885 [Vibrio mediterranei]MCF4176822.1 hypothetical protein [Vibrio sp. McD22-P3]